MISIEGAGTSIYPSRLEVWYIYKLVNLMPFNATVEFACNSVPVASAGWPPIAVLKCKMRSLLAVAVLLTMLVTLSTAQLLCKFQRL